MKRALTDTKGMGKNILYVVIVGLLFAVGFFAYKAYYPKTPDNTLIRNKPNRTITSTPTVAPAEGFQQLLAKYCSEKNEISISLLPFKLSPSTISKYKLTENVSCSLNSLDSDVKTQSGTRYIKMTNSDGTINPHASLLIGDTFSQDLGLNTDFSDVRKDKPAIVNGSKKVVVEIMAPGPYGVSSKGMWLNVKAYKYTGSCLVIATEFHVIEVKGDVLDLMKKYADKPQGSGATWEDAPQYTVNNRYNEFTDEFVKGYFSSYPNISEPYKTYVTNTLNELDSVTLK